MNARFVVPCFSLVFVGCYVGDDPLSDDDEYMNIELSDEASHDALIEAGLEDGVSEGLPDASLGGVPEAASDYAPTEVPGTQSCPAVVAAAAIDPFNMRLPSPGFGGIETQSNGGHTDVFLKSPAYGGFSADYTRIGARLDWGGSVVFFGLSSNPSSNVIDAHDPGRELQVAIYDPDRVRQPCAASGNCQISDQYCCTACLPGVICSASSTESCCNEDPAANKGCRAITYMGWNPVAGGDEFGNGASATPTQVGDALQIVTHPLQWNPDWNQPDCRRTTTTATPVNVTYRTTYRFVTAHVVEVATEVSSQETINHVSAGQEWPTLYVSNGQLGPDLTLLLNAASQTVVIDDGPTGDGFYWKNFTSSSAWSTWQNSSKTYGIGLAMDQGVKDFVGWRGNAPTYFHNVRATVPFALSAGKVVRGISYVALGGFGTVQGELTGVLNSRAPMGWVDAPAVNTVTPYTPGSSIAVSGWALDGTTGTQIRVEIDGVTKTTLSLSGYRQDVCNVYPAYAGCPYVGFSGSVSTAGLSACAHLLRMVAVDSQGNEQIIGERIIQPQ